MKNVNSLCSRHHYVNSSHWWFAPSSKACFALSDRLFASNIFTITFPKTRPIYSEKSVWAAAWVSTKSNPCSDSVNNVIRRLHINARFLISLKLCYMKDTWDWVTCTVLQVNDIRAHRADAFKSRPLCSFRQQTNQKWKSRNTPDDIEFSRLWFRNLSKRFPFSSATCFEGDCRPKTVTL